MRAGEPALLELLEDVGPRGRFPDGGRVWLAVLVEREGLEGVLDIRGDFGAGEVEFAPVGAQAEDADVRDAEGA